MRHQQQRIVERRHGHDDAAGLAHREAELVPAAGSRVDRDRLAVQSRGLARGQPDQIRNSRGLATRLGERLPLLGADRASQFFDSRLDQGGGPIHRLLALIRSEATHDRSPRDGRLERFFDILGAGSRHRVDQLSGIGIRDRVLERGRSPLPGDVHLHRLVA